MTITYIEHLSGRDALSLHKNFAGFAADRSVALVTTDNSKPIFLGRQYRGMRTLSEHLDGRLIGIAPQDIVGFSGPSVLSLHFKGSAYAEFQQEVVKARAFDDLTAQVGHCGEYMLLAIVQWGNLKNQSLHRAGKPLLRIQELGDKDRTVIVTMPDLESLKEFEHRKTIGLFAAEARSIEREAAGIVLEQHVA